MSDLKPKQNQIRKSWDIGIFEIGMLIFTLFIAFLPFILNDVETSLYIYTMPAGLLLHFHFLFGFWVNNPFNAAYYKYHKAIF